LSALENGNTSGGSTLSGVYEGVPPVWIRGGGPKIAWLPTGEPAWSDLLLNRQRVPEGKSYGFTYARPNLQHNSSMLTRLFSRSLRKP